MKGKWKLSEGDKSKMLSMYAEGHSKNSLARHFKVDHSTVYYHIKKQDDVQAGLSPMKMRFSSKIITRAPIPEHVDDDGSRLNKGMDYADYLAEDAIRLRKKQFECAHVKVITITRCQCCGKVEEH